MTSLHAEPIDRRKNLSKREFVEDYDHRLRPVIIEGAMPEWSAWEKWTLDFFRQRFGDRIVGITRGDQPADVKPQYTMREIVDLVEAGTEEKPAPYLMACDVELNFLELVPDVQPHLRYALPDRMAAPFFPPNWPFKKHLIEIFIGGKGSGTPIHHDPHHIHAFVMMMAGHKQITMFPPDQGEHLYIDPAIYTNSLVKGYTLDEIDLARFPNVARTTPLTGIIGPGDIVFIPGGWYHAVRILSPSISFGTNHVSRSNWQAFCHDLCLRQRNPHTNVLKKNIKKALYLYMRSTGVLIEAMERRT